MKIHTKAGRESTNMLLKCSVMALKTPAAHTKWATHVAGCRKSVCVGGVQLGCGAVGRVFGAWRRREASVLLGRITPGHGGCGHSSEPPSLSLTSLTLPGHKESNFQRAVVRLTLPLQHLREISLFPV